MLFQKPHRVRSAFASEGWRRANPHLSAPLLSSPLSLNSLSLNSLNNYCTTDVLSLPTSCWIPSKSVSSLFICQNNFLNAISKEFLPSWYQSLYLIFFLNLFLTLFFLNLSPAFVVILTPFPSWSFILAKFWEIVFFFFFLFNFMCGIYLNRLISSCLWELHRDFSFGF